MVSNNPLHENTLAVLRAWRATCSTDDSTILPMRLIDISSLPDSTDFNVVSRCERSWRRLFQNSACRLVETYPGQACRYSTLSYCWGAALPYTTTTQNIHEHRIRLDFVRLPRTLQDAIMEPDSWTSDISGSTVSALFRTTLEIGRGRLLKWLKFILMPNCA